jgi:rhamnulokinase
VPEPARYAAIDLGASSARVFAGRLDSGRLKLDELRRVPNRPVWLPDGLHWDLVHLFARALEALRDAGPLAGVGVDAWGCDYGLLDAQGGLLGVPFHYRDARTAGMVMRAHERVGADEAYAVTGVQTLPFNTLFQLLADEQRDALDRADRVALIPDLLTAWLTGAAVNERTIASTTGLLDARSGDWARPMIDRLGLAQPLFGELVDPGTALGRARAEHELGAVEVYAVAAHDTASAFVAAPVVDEHAAILSSGTWSLLGLELPAPVLGAAAREADLSNERGVDATTRLLRNVTGLWLEQECARTWNADHAELFAAAGKVTGDVALFDPDDPVFLAPGDMPARIAAVCAQLGQDPPEDRAQTIRAILVSLACKYRLVLEQLEFAAHRTVDRIHVIGGGARVWLLCALTADITGREVLAGPVEATAIGNILMQARAAGELASLSDIRDVVSASFACERHEPSADRDGAEATYRRFLDVTGLRQGAHA